MPTTLLFDLDDTLWDDSASLNACVLRVCDELKPHMPPFDAQALTTHYITTSDTFWLRRRYDPDLLPAARYGFWEETLACYGCDDPKVVTLARDAYVQYRHESAVCYEETHEVLSSLHGRYRMAIVTNGLGEQQRSRLSGSGIEHYFDAVVSATDIAAAKPEAALFHHALELLGVPPEKAWHIGDSLVSDVQGAHNAGLDGAVWLNRHGHERAESDPAPHHEVESLVAFVRVLERFGS